MLNNSARKEAIEKLNNLINKYKTHLQQVEQASVRLFKQRQRAINEVIEPVEDYANRLAHSPEEFERSVREYRIATDRFKSTVRQSEREYRTQQIEMKDSSSERVAAGAAGVAGATAGVGVAALGKTAAIAVATTFGTASTGTTISALAGAAAKSAALAWWGGGAIAAGGGGMAQGGVLLGLAGPIGWTIGGLAVAGSALYVRRSNRKTIEKANAGAVQVEGEIFSLRVASWEIRGLETSTRTHIEGTLAVLGRLSDNAPNDYQQFTPGQKHRLAGLVYHSRSLGELLRKEITL